jgi:hypothetical protein
LEKHPELRDVVDEIALKQGAYVEQGVPSLLTALRNAKLFEAIISDQEIATRALRAADTSRFAGDL